ncbi:MAG: lytic murein transglycosylase [Rhodobacteraceae bacterium]|nr:lytic murein transglycosylase [Paracoccaceae bacterium]
MAATEENPQRFEAWLSGIKNDALGKGIAPSTISRAFAGVVPIERVIELDRRQPEFTQTFGRYFRGVVSADRVRSGRAAFRSNRKLLSALEADYGVPARFLVAFWGLETNYGQFLGYFPVIGALSTLAFDGRRSEFFRSELFDALLILDHGHTTPQNMKGSWAGAIGQTQFMPSTFLKHAVDRTGDGHIDVWGSAADALASGANYLRNLGWNRSYTWGREVLLPRKFDARLASVDTSARDVVKSLSDWSALGLKTAAKAPLPNVNIEAALVLPAGISGPAFLVYDNYRVILKWNRATFYALAIGHLADRIAGGPALVTPLPDEPPLSRDEVIALQSGLSQLGFLRGEIDGVIGSESRAAVRAYQIESALPADGYANRALLDRVKRSAGAAEPT